MNAVPPLRRPVPTPAAQAATAAGATVPTATATWSRAVFACGLALVVLTVLSAVVVLWDGRQAQLRDWRHTVANLSTTFAAHAEQSMNAADAVLGSVLELIQDQNPRTPGDLASRLGTLAIHETLKDMVAGVPQIDVATILGLDGKVVNVSRDWPVPDMNLGDRDYVRALSVIPFARTYLSLPTRNRATGAWTFYLARQIQDPDGKPIGVAIIGIRSAFFQDFYRAANLGDFSAISLYRADGVLLAREPPADASIGTSFAETPIFREVLPRGLGVAIVGSGNSAVPSIDGTLRVVAPRMLRNGSMVSSVMVTEAAMLGTWNRTASNVALLTFAFVATILCTSLVLKRMFASQEATLADLVRARHDAEQAAAATTVVLEKLRASEASLNEKSKVLELTLDHIDQGLLMIDGNKRIAVHNRRAAQLLDVPQAMLAAQPLFSDLVDYQRAMGEFVAARITAAHVPGEAQLMTQPTTYERIRPNGSILEVHTIPMPDGGMVRTFTDITQRRESERQVRHLAHHDGLTQLANRFVFQQQLAEAKALADTCHGRLSVLSLDLDGFKLVNDTHGHAIGDRLLIEVATRLRSVVRSGDTVARIAGDEFGIIQSLIERPDAAQHLAGRILASVSAPYNIGDLRCVVGVSIGIVLYPDHAGSVDELLSHADVALYRAKASGKGSFVVFDEVMDRRQRSAFQLEQELKQALPADEFFLEYQPIMRTLSQEPCCYEALIRWRHPVRGVIGPADFIELAERSGLIVPLGLWVLETACRTAATWPGDIGVAVNVSPVQFSRADLPGQVHAALASSGLAPGRLTLEVTEGVMLEDTEAVFGAMTTLRAIGVQFSLDDFGTAQSRLTYLRRFPFDVIKIDKSFVQHAVEEAGARAIVAAVIAIGRAFHLSVIAEGIERDDQLALLRDMGCDLVQGYLFGTPTASPQPAPPARSV